MMGSQKVYSIDLVEHYKQKVEKELRKELLPVYLLLWEKYFITAETWIELCTILNSNREDEKLLLETISVFCRRATDAMWHVVINNLVSFAAGKPGKSVGDYASFLKLRQLASSPAVTIAVNEYVTKVRPLQTVRNEHVAHWGLTALTDRDHVQVHIEEIKELLAQAEQVLITFEEAFNLSGAPMPRTTSQPGGAQDLLRVLRSASKNDSSV